MKKTKKGFKVLSEKDKNQVKDGGAIMDWFRDNWSSISMSLANYSTAGTTSASSTEPTADCPPPEPDEY